MSDRFSDLTSEMAILNSKARTSVDISAFILKVRQKKNCSGKCVVCCHKAGIS